MNTEELGERFNDRAISHLRNGLGLSDEEIEDLELDEEDVMEQVPESTDESMSELPASPVGEVVEESDDGGLNEVLQALQEQREATEEHLDSVDLGEDSDLLAEFEENIDGLESYFGSMVDDYERLSDQNEGMAETYRRDLKEINGVLEEVLESSQNRKRFRELSQRVEWINDEIESVLMSESERRRSREMIEYFRDAPRLTDY